MANSLRNILDFTITEEEKRVFAQNPLFQNGWVYCDMTARVPLADMLKLCWIFGEAEKTHVVLAMTRNHKTSAIRGQFLLSPEAVIRYQDYNKDDDKQANYDRMFAAEHAAGRVTAVGPRQ